MLKIIGILVLIVGLVVGVIGLGGAVLNLVFPPKELTCTMADEHFAKAEKAVKDYEAAKGSPQEVEKKAEADRALASSATWSDSCASSKESSRFYGMIFAGIGVLGAIIFFFGALITFFGFRRKKVLA